MNTPRFHSWLIEPPPAAMSAAVDRLLRAPDVQHLALMPDAHLATEVCVGTVFSTTHLIYPQAVGGDIGCGMLAMSFDLPAASLSSGAVAGEVLSGIDKAIPTLRRHRNATMPMPGDLPTRPLSDPALEAFRHEAGALQFGTLGSGNHFVELQSDEADRLWLMVHSGSRAMGQAIRDHHLARGEPVGSGLRALDANDARGLAYLHDLQWARDYAAANRIAMASRVIEVLSQVLRVPIHPEALIALDHNHVAAEMHGDQSVWVHRKGAMPAGEGVAGVVPGSMGTPSFHVTGHGVAESLSSSAHGAGRKMSREQARKTIGERYLHQQMLGIWYDYRRAHSLREEAPSAYKDVRSVMRAQRDLVRIDRTLKPVLNFKG